MRPHRVVAEFLGEEEELTQLSERIGWVKHLVELLSVRALGPLDAAVELGRASWQDAPPRSSGQPNGRIAKSITYTPGRCAQVDAALAKVCAALRPEAFAAAHDGNKIVEIIGDGDS